jgi:hypothetical protein
MVPAANVHIGRTVPRATGVLVMSRLSASVKLLAELLATVRNMARETNRRT